MSRKINQAGLDLIKEFEGVRLKAYKDSVGILTIGVGHTGPDVQMGLEISADQAEDLLRNDLGTAERGVEAAIGNIGNSNQFSACVSLAFNVGVHAFSGSSIVKLMKAGDMFGAADRFMQWNKAGGMVLKGLTRRREAERKLFLTPDEDEESSADTVPLPDVPTDEPTTPPVTATTTVEHHDFVQTIAANDTVKEIAKSGVTQIGARVSTGLATGGLLSAADAFIQKHYVVLIFSGGLILLAVIVVLFILWHKSQQQKLTAQINSDPTRSDVRL